MNRFFLSLLAFCAIYGCHNLTLDKNERKLGSMKTILEQVKLLEDGSDPRLDSVFMADYEYITSNESADTAQIAQANKLLGQYMAIKIELGIEGFAKDFEKWARAIEDFTAGFNAELEK